jgi:isoleucyl-tRNA synthetase
MKATRRSVWLISKKNRYWGLALPIYDCQCGHFEVIGSKEELKKRSIEGWAEFEGNSPHKPWIDLVKIKCSKCGKTVDRIGDVGNVWLDAGIVPFSTLPSEWFPADFITESFPGQFKNWFYAMIAMSTVLAKANPFKTVLGYASLLAEDGRPMHKSWGNSIDFNEGADKIGVDVMRWMYATHNPTDNMLFGYKKADETRRRFHLTLWNIFNFFVTYANLDNFSPVEKSGESKNLLDIWVQARLKQTIQIVTQSLDQFDAYKASLAIEDFVSDLSLWYVRRSRDRVGPSSDKSTDNVSCHTTLYFVLTNLSIVLSPFIPFMSDYIYRTLTHAESVHLAAWPKLSKLSASELELFTDMQAVRKAVEMGLAHRKVLGIKVRQPLSDLSVVSPHVCPSPGLLELIKDEVNVKNVTWSSGSEWSASIDAHITPELEEEGRLRQLIRDIQELRKVSNIALDQKIKLIVPSLPKDLAALKQATLASEVSLGDSLALSLC